MCVAHTAQAAGARALILVEDSRITETLPHAIRDALLEQKQKKQNERGDAPIEPDAPDARSRSGEIYLDSEGAGAQRGLEEGSGGRGDDEWGDYDVAEGR